jgi:hypothetical protein
MDRCLIRRCGAISFVMMGLVLAFDSSSQASAARRLLDPVREATTDQVATPSDSLEGMYTGALFCTRARRADLCGEIELGYNFRDAVAAARRALGSTAGGGNMVSAVTVIYSHRVICGVGLSSDPPCD